MNIEMDNYKTVLYDDFRILAIPLSSAEKEKLEYSVICNDFRQTIPIWHNRILDCFDYYDICKANDIPFETKKRRFRTKNDATIWVCRNYLSNPNITKSYRNYLIGVLFEAEYKNILRADVTPGEDRKTKMNLSEELGREYNIGLHMANRYDRYARTLKKMLKKSEQLGMMILTETVLISHPALDALITVDDDALAKVVDTIEDYDVPCRIQYKPGPSYNNEPNISIRPEARSRSSITLPVQSVKNLPTPDPDAEVSSLALTIPTWVNSIRRKCNATIFDDVSLDAKAKLETELHNLLDEINNAMGLLREDEEYEEEI